jgi:hypothetical protein
MLYLHLLFVLMYHIRILILWDCFRLASAVAWDAQLKYSFAVRSRLLRLFVVTGFSS